jgi:uncharacterized protein YjbI with pentapeptide repeats
MRFEANGWFVEKLGELISFRSVRLEGLDLSGADLPSLRFHDSTIKSCRFDGAKCHDWRLWGTEVSDSTFVRATLRGAAVGTGHEGRRNSWRRTDFSRSDFRIGVSEGAVYEDCTFVDAKLDNVKFGQCSFIRCQFAGKISNVLFDGRELSDRPAPPPMEDVDFSAASFRHVEFKGFDLEAVALPDDPRVRLVRRGRCAARRGIELLDGDERVAARQLRAVLQNRLRGPGNDREASVFNRTDYLELGGPELADLAEDIFSRAEADCLRG